MDAITAAPSASSPRPRTKPLDEADRVIDEANALVAAGYSEIVISGINLGRWGRDFQPQQKFEDLVRALLDIHELEKIRISSVEPMDWSDELIALVAESPRIAKHAHVPLQSGSDRILRRMHRKYRPWHYAEKIRKIREAMPDAAIGADVMVGFPGETDELFEESRSFIAHCRSLICMSSPTRRAPDAIRGHARPGPGACGARAQSSVARAGSGKEPRVPPEFCWTMSGSHYATGR